MEKLRFAIQVIAFTLALPVYFIAELNHNTKEQHAGKGQTTVQMNYTKNGKDRTPGEAVNATSYQKPVYTKRVK